MLIVYADGIGSASLPPDSELSILYTAAKRLGDTRDARVLRVEWPASMAGVGGPMSWDRSSRLGVQHIDRIMVAHPREPVVLLGYSGGCKVVHDWLDQHPESLDRIAAVGLMSDPFRPKGKNQHGTPMAPHWGICGPRPGPIPGRTFWSAWPDDVITACPPDSPLRTLADLSDRIPGGFLDDFGRHLRLGNWQLANYIKLWKRDPLAYLLGLGPRMNAARRGVEGYLGTEHTLAYVREFTTVSPDGTPDRRSLAVRLADTISYKVR